MKKMRGKIISIFITACMLFSLMPQLNLTAAAAVWVGGATATSWYDAEKASFTITTPEELAGFASLVNDGNTFSDKTVSLGANIFLNDVSAVSSWNSSTTGLNSWTPIGGSSSTFNGTFDGCGYTVSGIYISTTADYQALFGNVNGGTIKNVGVVDSYISGGSYGSGLIGYCENTAITNCYNTGSVTGISTNSSFIGGVAGRCISGTITDSYNTGSVSTQGSTFGGLVGRNESSPITRCYNTGSVTGLFYGSSNVGGLVGGNYGISTMTNSYNTGSVAGGSNSSNAGGLVGDNRCTITNCYNAGHVSGYTPLGGIAGYNSGTVTSCYYDSQTSGVSGGINGSDAAGAVGKTTAWLKNATSTAGVDGDGGTFENWDTAVWDFAADAYPQLRTVSYGIGLSQTAPYTFTAQTVGYSSMSPLSVTVSNTGNQATGDLAVALTGTGKDCFTLSGATIGSIAASGTDTFTIKPNDSLTAGTYTATVTVSSSNVTSQSFTVSFTVESDTRSSAKAITGFTLSGVDGTISETDHTIAVTLPYATDVTSLTPTITVSANATVSPASGTSQDFTNPVTYTVTAENESMQTYTITVTVESDTRSSAKAITGFTLGGTNGTINETDHTIAVTLPYGTDVTSLTPTITASANAAVSPATAQNFTSPVTYTVTAENESTQDYTVTVTIAKNSAKAIIGFKIGSVNGTINETNQTIAVTLPFGTDVTNLTPTITVSDKAAVSPASGVAQNFTSPVTYTVTADDGSTQDYTVTVTVNAASSTGGDAGSGGPSSSGSTNSSSITVTTDAGTTTATQTVSATTGSNGVAAANVTKDQITDMMKVASEKAQAQNMQTSLKIKVDSGSGATGVSVTLPQAAVSTLTDGEASLTVSSTVATVTLDSTTLAEIGKQASGDVTITATAADTSALSADTKTAIGIRPVYDLKITSGSTTVSSFGGGTATVSVPYTPAAGEDVNAIVVYYINASGELVTVPNCVYDAKTGTVTFTTTHFSTYAVGYNAVSFSDVSDSAWYADYVAYLAARNIIGGNNGAFSPAADITRVEFVTILARMSGDDLSGYKTSSFSDVSADSWYFTAVQWANKAGIASGYDGAFSPDATITREQMAAMLYRYAEYKGMVSNAEGMSVREFTDYDSISSWAQAPIQWAMNNDIISGNPDGSFAPSANATRAQAAKMISTLIQNII